MQNVRTYSIAMTNNISKRILECLENGPLNVTNIQITLRVEQSIVSQQLKRLREIGVVIGEKKGSQVFYTIVKDYKAINSQLEAVLNNVK